MAYLCGNMPFGYRIPMGPTLSFRRAEPAIDDRIHVVGNWVRG